MVRTSRVARLLSVGLVCVALPVLADAAMQSAHVRIREVETAVLRGEADLLRVRLKEEAKARPRDVMLRVLIAWCDMPSDEAWNALRGVATIHPENGWARLGMGRVYLRWKLYDQAEAEFQLALKSNPSFHPAQTGLADAARLTGRHADAAALYRTVLTTAPDDPDALTGLGLSLLALGKKEEGRAQLVRSVEKWAEQPEALRELAGLSREAGALPEAVEWTARLVALSPRDAEARRDLGELRLRAGQKREAVEELERALRLGLVTVEIHRQLAAIHRELADAEGERRSVEQLARLERSNPAHPIRLSELAHARGDGTQAEGHLLEAIERTGGQSPRLLLRLARLQSERDLVRDALESFRKAASLTGSEDGAEADAIEEARREVELLSAKLALPSSPAQGTVERIHAQVSKGLDAFYRHRLGEAPALAGELAVRVRLDDTGAVRSVDVVKDTVGDPLLAAHAYFALKEAVYPAQRREPVFEFTLVPAATKKGKGRGR